MEFEEGYVESEETKFWRQKTIPELIDLLGQLDTDKRSANIAAAILENLKIPKKLKTEFLQKTKDFIHDRMNLLIENDSQIALRCAIRKFLFLQGDNIFIEVERLLKELPLYPPDNQFTVLITFVDCLRARAPKNVIEAPSLVAELEHRCRTCLHEHLLAYTEIRIITSKCLMALILMGRPEAKALIEETLKFRSLSRLIKQRSENFKESLTKKNTGLKETHDYLDYIINYDSKLVN